MFVRSTQELVEQLQAILSLASTEPGELKSVLIGLRAEDIAEVLASLTEDEALRIFAALDDVRASHVLSHVNSELSQYFTLHAPESRTTQLLKLLPTDDAAEVLANVNPERADKLLTALHQVAPKSAIEVRELLSYRENTAGRFMSDKFVRLREEMTVEGAFAAIRHADSDVETLTDLYVMARQDAKGEEKLIGILSLRQLVRADPSATLADIMTRDLITVTVDTDQEEVARLISKYDFLAMPVLDRSGYMVGIITVDDVIDVLVEEQTEDIFRQSAITTEPGVLNLPYFSVPIWTVTRSRVTWLVLLFVAETATGTVLRHFEGDLVKVTALGFFVPLLIGTGGNTGAQTVSTIIRGLALGEIRLRDSWRVLARELSTGLLLGVILGLIAFGRAMLWNSGFELSLVVGLTILTIVVWANTVGALIPLIAQRFRVDPALVSAPLITTLVDATGLVIYFFIAKLFLEQLR